MSHHPARYSYQGDADFAASRPSNIVNQLVSAPAPSVTSVSPADGPGTVGTIVQIKGVNLCQVMGVNFRTAATPITGVQITEPTRPHHEADLANALLTTDLETWS